MLFKSLRFPLKLLAGGVWDAIAVEDEVVDEEVDAAMEISADKDISMEVLVEKVDVDVVVGLALVEVGDGGGGGGVGLGGGGGGGGGGGLGPPPPNSHEPCIIPRDWSAKKSKRPRDRSRPP